MVETASQVLA